MLSQISFTPAPAHVHHADHCCVTVPCRYLDVVNRTVHCRHACVMRDAGVLLLLLCSCPAALSMPGHAPQRAANQHTTQHGLHFHTPAHSDTPGLGHTRVYRCEVCCAAVLCRCFLCDDGCICAVAVVVFATSAGEPTVAHTSQPPPPPSRLVSFHIGRPHTPTRPSTPPSSPPLLSPHVHPVST